MDMNSFCIDDVLDTIVKKEGKKKKKGDKKKKNKFKKSKEEKAVDSMVQDINKPDIDDDALLIDIQL